MKTYKKIILGILLSVAMIGTGSHFASAQVSGQTLWKLVSGSIQPMVSTWKLGSSSSRISEGWFTTLNATNLTVGGASAGNLAMGGFNISDIGTATGAIFIATSTTATSTFAGGVSVGSRGYGFADGTYQTTAASAGVSLSADNTWTGGQTFGNATTTNATSTNSVITNATITTGAVTNLTATNATTTGKLNVPNGASPSVVTTGDVAIDTTSDQLIGFGASAKKVYGNGNIYAGFTYATSTAWVGTSTIPLGTARVAEIWNDVQCYTDTGTVQVSFNDGTNRMNFINASTTADTNVLSTNNTFTSGEKRYVDIGTPASSPTKISCTVSKSITAD